MALAAPAGVNLRLDHPERAVELAGRRLGLFGAQHDAPFGHRRAMVAEQGFRLIFVDMHGTAFVVVPLPTTCT